MLDIQPGVNTRAQVRHRLRELTTMKISLRDEMQRLLENWQIIFRTSAPLHPVVQSVAGGYVYVRWRASGRQGDQAYIDPTSECAAQVWQSHPPLQSLLRDEWRRTLELNTAYSIAHGQWLRLRQYLADLERLDVNLAVPV